jgi:hypothetical protein
MHFATDSTGNCTLIRLSYRSGTASVLRRGTTQIATRGTLLPNSHRNQRGTLATSRDEQLNEWRADGDQVPPCLLDWDVAVPKILVR